MRKRKYCDQGSVFRFIWNNCDRDGMWTGDAATIAAEFNVGEDEAYGTLSELTDRNRLERVGSETYIITGWRERDDLGEGELES